MKLKKLAKQVRKLQAAVEELEELADSLSLDLFRLDLKLNTAAVEEADPEEDENVEQEHTGEGED